MKNIFEMNDHNKGFSFQQYHRYLDLESFSDISNIDRLIQDNEIDILQQYFQNYTYCRLRTNDLTYFTDSNVIKFFKITQLIIEYLLFLQDNYSSNLLIYAKKYVDKKKSIAKKRLELINRKESYQLLKSNINLKKKKLNVLEKVINAILEKRNTKNPTRNNEIQDNEVPEHIKFFISGEGICIEFVEHQDTLITTIAKNIKHTLNYSNENVRMKLKLIYKGKVLNGGNNTLLNAEIKNGDTIVVIFNNSNDNNNNNNKFNNSSNTNYQNEKKSKIINNELLCEEPSKTNIEKSSKIQVYDDSKIISNQENDAKDQKIKLQLKNKLNKELYNISGNNLKSQFCEKLPIFKRGENIEDLTNAEIIEDDISIVEKDKISSEFKHNLKQINNKKDLNIGEIESDEDEVCDVDIPKVLSRLNALEEMMENEVKKKYQQNKIIVDKDNISNQIISDVFSDNNNKISQIVIDPNEFNNTNESLLISIKEEDVIQDIIIPEVINEIIVLESKVEDIIIDDECSINDDHEENENELSNDEITDVFITFSSKINPDLRQYNDGEEIIVCVKCDVTVDDLIFEIRSTIADKILLPLSQIKLSYYGQIVTSGVDVDDDNLTALSASNLAKSGQLLVKIVNINLSQDITDFLSEYQLDILVKQFEGNFNTNNRNPNKINNNNEGRLFYENNNNFNSSEDIKEDYKINKVNNFDLTVLDDETNLIEQQDTIEIKNTLNDIYESMSQSEGFTDDELNEKIQLLKKSTNSLKLKKNYDNFRHVEDEFLKISNIVSENETDDSEINEDKANNMFLSVESISNDIKAIRKYNIESIDNEEDTVIYESDIEENNNSDDNDSSEKLSNIVNDEINNYEMKQNLVSENNLDTKNATKYENDFISKVEEVDEDEDDDEEL